MALNAIAATAPQAIQKSPAQGNWVSAGRAGNVVPAQYSPQEPLNESSNANHRPVGMARPRKPSSQNSQIRLMARPSHASGTSAGYKQTAPRHPSFPIIAFLTELQETAAFATHKKYQLLLTKMIEFSANRGYVMVDQWEPTDVRDFRTS